MKLPSTAADVLTDARCSMSSPSTVESIDRLYLNVSSWSCRRRPTPQAPPARSPRATSRDRAVERGEMAVAHGLTALAAAVISAPRMTADSPVSARPRQCEVRCTRVHRFTERQRHRGGRGGEHHPLPRISQDQHRVSRGRTGADECPQHRAEHRHYASSQHAPTAHRSAGSGSTSVEQPEHDPNDSYHDPHDAEHHAPSGRRGTRRSSCANTRKSITRAHQFHTQRFFIR